MAYSAVPLVATGDLWTAANQNTYLRDNMAAIWVGTTAGDVDYYTGAAAKSRLAIGAAGGVMMSNGVAPSWLGIGTAGQALLTNAGATAPEWDDVATEVITRRQGGSATDWNTQGTNNYTPSGTFIQCGVKRIALAAAATSNVTVTFPTAFTNVPVIIFGWPSQAAGAMGAGGYSMRVSTATTTTFKIYLSSDTNPTTVTFDVGWIAMGD